MPVIYRGSPPASITVVDSAQHPPPPASPTITGFSATPSTVVPPQGAVLNATVSNAVALAIDGVTIAGLPHTVFPTATTTYTLTATGAAGTTPATASVDVTVSATSQPGLAWFTSKASGSVTNIGANVLQSLNPWAPSAGPGNVGFPAILAASGSAFCPWRGAAGSLVIFGGGHNDYQGNDVYEFDCGAQTYAQLKPANWPLFLDPTSYQADATNGEHWTDATFTTTRQDQPSSGHNYGQVDAIPPNAQFPQGAVITYARPSIPIGGQRHGKRAHVFDFATKAWRRFSTGTFIDGTAFGGGFVDKSRNRSVVPSDRALFTLDLGTGVIGPKMGNYPSGVIHMVWHHDVAHDVYVGFVYRLPVPLLWIVDPVSAVWTAPGIAGTWPTPGLNDAGSCWSELLGGIAHYHGQGESVVSVIKAPLTGNVRTTPWNVTSVSFTGATPAKDTMSGAGAHCKRFLEHNAAGGFLWLGNTQAPAQFFRV